MTVITDKKAFTAATRIFATDRKRLAAFVAHCTPAQRRWIEGAGFDGAAHSHCSVPGKNGEVDFILVGVHDAHDIWALAGLPLKLAKARYELGKDAPGSVRISADKAAFAWALGCYQFTRYKKAKRKPADLQCDASPKVRATLEVAEAVCLVRDMVNTPAEDLSLIHI